MNENNKSQRDFSAEGILSQLDSTAIPMTKKGIVWKETTPNLCSKIVDLVSTTYGIPEIDHCYMYPEKDNNGDITWMSCVMYFIPDANGGNISRPKGFAKRGGARLDNGSTDLRGFVTNKISNGGFALSPNFKKFIGAIAKLDDNGDIIVKPAPRGNVAVVDIDFFKLMSIILKIDPDSNFDFEVTDLEPMNNKSNSIDYVITLTKFVQTARRKGKKSGVNYDDMDSQYNNGYRNNRRRR